MDERIMHLFSLIAGQVRSKEELFDDEGKIMSVLVDNGCHLHEADAALSLMQALSRGAAADLAAAEPVIGQDAVRAMSRTERARFTTGAFGFLSRLARLGIITEEVREELLERAMGLYTGRIELDHIKALTALALFTTDSEGEYAAGQELNRFNNTVWN